MSVDKAIESIKKVKLRGGIFGKTTLLLVVLVVGVCVVAFKASVPWVALALVLPLMLLVFYALKRSFDFAHAHPYVAAMEGGELLQHERIVHSAKGLGVIPASTVVVEDTYVDVALLEVEEVDALPTPEDEEGKQ